MDEQKKNIQSRFKNVGEDYREPEVEDLTDAIVQELNKSETKVATVTSKSLVEQNRLGAPMCVLRNMQFEVGRLDNVLNISLDIMVSRNVLNAAYDDNELREQMGNQLKNEILAALFRGR